MKQRQFLCKMAVENACAGVGESPLDHGFETWEQLFDALSETDSIWYTDSTGGEIILCECYTYSDTLETALAREYNNAAWVLQQATECGVTYEA